VLVADGRRVDRGTRNSPGHRSGLSLGARRAVGSAAVLGVILLVLFAYYFLGSVPHYRNPNWADTILGDRAVVAAVRAAVLLAALFVALSAIAHIFKRRWLEYGAGLGVAKAVKEAVQDAPDEYAEIAREYEASNRELTEQLERSSIREQEALKARNETLEELRALERSVSAEQARKDRGQDK